MIPNKLYVEESAIHGKGLFAKKKIKKGEHIGNIKTKPTKKKSGPYVLWLDEKERVKVTCHLRYINHSSSPNACYYDTLEVIALRDIEPGEEITHDYSGDGSEWGEL